jgi:hypothetical protein
MGFESYEAFLSANPGLSYDEMARLLGEGDVAPVQLQRLHASGVKSEHRELAVVDSLARFLRGALRKGWGVGKYWEGDLMGALASWHTTWGGGAELDRLQTALLAAKPPMGWLPEPKDDPLLQRITSLAQRASWSRRAPEILPRDPAGIMLRELGTLVVTPDGRGYGCSSQPEATSNRFDGWG